MARNPSAIPEPYRLLDFPCHEGRREIDFSPTHDFSYQTHLGQGRRSIFLCLAHSRCEGKAFTLSGKGKHPDVFPATGARKPNIVLMLMDNLGYGELGVYGGGILRGVPTPRIDKLASESTRLLNFNVEAQCTPSRSALMTGRYPIRSGTYQVPRGVPEGLTTWEITLPHLLSAQGYGTGTPTRM